MITYVKGDATLPQGSGVKIIAHVCNDGPGWGAGFVMALSARDTHPENRYRTWARQGWWAGEPFKLGHIQVVQFDPAHQLDTYVANMLAQILVSSGDDTWGIPLRYYELETCLIELNQQAQFCLASVHMPRIGCGLAGGSWHMVEPIIARTLTVPVTIYDYETRQQV
jgi:O-acetyl-ADP-ribose deacetylase (regulator of RNase III)